MSTTTQFKCSWAHFELTSNCNLACVYCAVSQPWYQGTNLSADKAIAVSNWLLKNNVPNININGHGETTIVKGWTTIIEPLLSSSARCHIITNAAKVFGRDELETLCKLNSITISCDTFDADLYASLRRKSQLRNVLNAIVQIRETAKRLRRKPPKFILSCVLGAENSHSLEDFILKARCMDVKAIQLCSLTDYPFPPETDFKLNPLSTLSKQKLSKLADVLAAHASIDEGFLNVHPGITSEINQSLAS
jgi:molybdenum cofactor biosynthesis enzyme MoaA